MQMAWSLVCLFCLLLAVNLVMFLNSARKRRAEYRMKRLTKQMVFLTNCAEFGLSDREVEVLRLILEGKTYREVGEVLFISEKTVDSHMQHIYEKVGVRNKLALLNKLYT